MATTVLHAVRSSAAWNADIVAMEARYGVGNYYTSLNSWVYGQERDLVAADEIAKVEVYDDFITTNNNTDLFISFAWNSDVDRYIHIKVMEGNDTNGVRGQGFHLGVCTIFQPHFKLEGMAIRRDASNGNLLRITQEGFVGKRCYLDGKNSIARCFRGGGELSNSVVLGNNFSDAMKSQNGVEDLRMYNCTIVGGVRGIVGYVDEMKNNIFVDQSSSEISNMQGTPTYSRNIVENPANYAPGQFGILNVAAFGLDKFVDAAAFDYHPKIDSGAIGVGEVLTVDYELSIEHISRVP